MMSFRRASGYTVDKTNSSRPSDPEHSHTALATALDGLAIAGAAAALVLLLGSRRSFLLGTALVAVPGALRLLVFSMMTVAIRLVISPRLRILPLFSVERMRLSPLAERERFSYPPPATPEVKYYALGAAIASMVWLMPQLTSIRSVPDPGDPLLSSWRLARLAHQLLNEPLQLFDGNIFHPTADTLTYSDATVLEGVVALPFLAAGTDPLVVSNVLLIASFPLCALAFFYAGWRLTDDPQAGAVAGMLGGLASFKTEHYSHLELQFFFFAPLAVVALMRFLAAPSWRRGAVLGATVAAQGLACMYFGVMLLVFLAPMVVLLAAAWRIRPTQRLAVGAVTCAAVVATAVSILAIPYVRTRDVRGERSMKEVQSFSAQPRDYATAHGRLVTYRNLLGTSEHYVERELFPGGLTLLLASAAVGAPLTLGKIVLLGGTVAAFDGSLGTNGLIYDELYKYVLPFRGMRVPARFAALVTTGLILLAAFGAQQLFAFGRHQRHRLLLFGVVAVAALVDLRARVTVQPFANLPPIYSNVTSDMVLAELPMESGANLHYMYFSTFHWARLINGHSGYVPDDYTRLQSDMAAFPRPDLVRRLRQRRTTHITVNCRLYSEATRCREVLDAIDGMLDFQLISSAIWESAEVRLYALRDAASREP